MPTRVMATSATTGSLSLPRAGHLAGLGRAGAPLGDPKALPPPRTFPEGWAIGTPDVVFELPSRKPSPRRGRSPTSTCGSRPISRRTCGSRPPRPSPATARWSTTSSSSSMTTAASGGRGSGVSSPPTRPATSPRSCPPASPRRSRPGPTWFSRSTTRPIGTVRTDRSRVGLDLRQGAGRARGAYARDRAAASSRSPRRGQPPGRARRTRSRSDAHLLDLMPHMHLRGKSFEYTATYPDGSSEILLSVPATTSAGRSSTCWPSPRRCPRGRGSIAWPTSTTRPITPPTPTRTPVSWGDQTFEEMMIGYIVYVDDEPVRAPDFAGVRPGRSGDPLRDRSENNFAVSGGRGGLGPSPKGEPPEAQPGPPVWGLRRPPGRRSAHAPRPCFQIGRTFPACSSPIGWQAVWGLGTLDSAFRASKAEGGVAEGGRWSDKSAPRSEHRTVDHFQKYIDGEYPVDTSEIGVCASWRPRCCRLL